MSLTEDTKQILRQTLIEIIGQSDGAKRMRDFGERAAATDHTILLRGETGSGKDHLAEFIHSKGRADRSFVPVDCGALTESLSETELFGHTRGAFTDAQSVKPGLVQVAEEGTLFFNEVANMSASLQAKFLRVLEKRSYRAVGGVREMTVNARIIAATNADLEAAVRRGELRSDLYHRLNTISFVVPTLRERSDDIPDLADYFLRREDYSNKSFLPDALAVMMGYHWPGNVRELMNAVVRAAFLSGSNQEIQAEHVHPYLTGVGDQELPTLAELQRRYFREVIRKCRGNVSQVAAVAGIDVTTAYREIRRFNLGDFVDTQRKNVGIN